MPLLGRGGRRRCGRGRSSRSCGGLSRVAFRDRHRLGLRGRWVAGLPGCGPLHLVVVWFRVRGCLGRASGHQKTPASRRGSRWFSVVPVLPPRSSVLLPGAGNQAKKAVQPKKKRAKNRKQYDVDDAGLGQRHIDPATIAGDDDGDVATVLPVDQAHVRLRGDPRRQVPSGSGECTRRRSIAQPCFPHRRYPPQWPIFAGTAQPVSRARDVGRRRVSLVRDAGRPKPRLGRMSLVDALRRNWPDRQAHSPAIRA